MWRWLCGRRATEPAQKQEGGVVVGRWWAVRFNGSQLAVAVGFPYFALGMDNF